nr:MAG TPA: DNA-binding protein [Bacteriophage sp.]
MLAKIVKGINNIIYGRRPDVVVFGGHYIVDIFKYNTLVWKFMTQEEKDRVIKLADDLNKKHKTYLN